MVKKEELIRRSASDGEHLINSYFSNHKDILKLSNIEIYNRMVLETRFNPVNSDVAVYLLSFIDEMRRIYSNKKSLTIFNELLKYKDYKPEEPKGYTIVGGTEDD